MEDYETPLGDDLSDSDYMGPDPCPRCGHEECVCYGEAYEDYDGEYGDDGLSDVEADAMTLASVGWGTDEDYFTGSFDNPY